jgi:hypothetical protein
MLYLGYDEVAHHSGPWTTDAFGDLKRLDHTFARLREVARERAPRPYDLIILSDHGQSFGPTFKQRYGLSIKELIERHMPQGTTVSQAIGGDTGANGLHSVAGELANVQQSGNGNVIDRVVASQGQRLAEQGADAADEAVEAGDRASVTAYGSGNAAQVYFDLYPRKIKLTELQAAYPGVVEAVVQHEGIGLVLGYEDDGSVVVLGKGGRRNLDSGEVTGDDPVLPYARESGPGAASLEKRIWQLKRVMDFPSAGDLWLISTVYPDGTVAALEELVGNHGGLGGEQTDAFIFHPADMEVSETRNSTDVFHILNNHRGAPVVVKAPAMVPEEIHDWAPGTMLTGLGQFTTWIGYALRCLFLDGKAYQAVANNPYMTGPALLIMLVMVSLGSVARNGSVDLIRIAGDIGLWFVAVFILYLAGVALTRQGTFTKTFRAVGFAQSVYLVGILALVLSLAPLFRLLMLVLGFVATWLAASTAHEIRGWRTFLLPGVAFLILILGAVIIAVLFAGAEFTLQGVLYSLGLRASP